MMRAERLPRGAAGRGSGSPFFAGGRIAAEHALAGTGRVHQDFIEKLRQHRRELFGQGIDDDGIVYAQPLHGGREDFDPGGIGFVGDDQTFSHQGRGQLTALSAGRGAQIKHPVAGLNVQRYGRGHRAGFLNIVCAGKMQRREAGAGILFIIPAGGAPFDRSFNKGRGGGLRIFAEGIQAQGVGVGTLHLGEE